MAAPPSGASGRTPRRRDPATRAHASEPPEKKPRATTRPTKHGLRALDVDARADARPGRPRAPAERIALQDAAARLRSTWYGRRSSSRRAGRRLAECPVALRLAERSVAPVVRPERPVPQVHRLAATPRFYRDDRGFDPEDEYWFVSESVSAMLLAITLGGLCVYGCWSYGRKTCWRCQRDVAPVETEEEAPRNRCGAGSRRQRCALVVWLVATAPGGVRLSFFERCDERRGGAAATSRES